MQNTNAKLAMMCSNTFSINHKISSLPDCVVKFSVNTTFVANVTVSGGKLLSFWAQTYRIIFMGKFLATHFCKKHVERTGFLFATHADGSRCELFDFKVLRFLMMLCNLFD